MMIFTGKKQADKWREYIRVEVEKNENPNITYINGKDVFGEAKYLSSDEVHPNIYGCKLIADRLKGIVSKNHN